MKFAFIVTGSIFLQSYCVSDNVWHSARITRWSELVKAVTHKLNQLLRALVHRDAYSPASFIPRGSGELGNGNLPFLGNRGI